MRNINSIIIFFLSVFAVIINKDTVIAQNLVPNPSFEECDTCPWTQCQVHFAHGWDVCGWTPDYFNVCAYDEAFGVPNNLFGYQYPNTGIAYCGIDVYEANLSNVREYIGIELSIPLQIGQQYYASIKVSLIENAYYAINKLGILFTTQNYALPSCPISIGAVNTLFSPPNYAHVFSDEIILDTSSWATVSGWFTADSIYNYIIIGNFFDDLHTNCLTINPFASSQVSYYYIDDIYVGKDSISDKRNTTKLKTINIYPNPLNEFANVMIDNEYLYDNPQFTLLDLTGIDRTHEASIKKLNSKEYIIQRNNLPNGIYFFEIKDNYNNKSTQKIIFN